MRTATVYLPLPPNEAVEEPVATGQVIIISPSCWVCCLA